MEGQMNSEKTILKGHGFNQRIIHSTSASSRRHIYKNIQAGIKKVRSNIKKGQCFPYTSRRTASPCQE